MTSGGSRRFSRMTCGKDRRMFNRDVILEMHMKPPTPSNEVARLKALRDYEILDTPPEWTFDDITSLAASICEAPMAMVSLVDETRQWFKSKVGIEACETPRGISFCAHVICQDGILQVGDAREDERFASNPWVTGDPGLRFYAGVPLVTSGGHKIGTLCVADRIPRGLNAVQLKTLEVLGQQVVNLIELRKQVHEKAAANRKILRLNRFHALLSKFNSALAGYREIAEMLDATCHMAVATSGLRAAVVGMQGPGGVVELAASAADTGERLQMIRRAGMFHDPEAGPAAEVMRGKRRFVCSETAQDIAGGCWEVLAHACDCGAVAVFPLIKQEVAFGALVLFAEAPGFFKEDDLDLLDGFAADVSRGVEYIEHDKQRRESEVALRDSEERYRLAFDQDAMGICMISMNGRFSRVNDRFCEIVERPAEELLSNLTHEEITHGDDRAADQSAMKSLLGGERTLMIEKRYVGGTGKTIWVRMSFSVVGATPDAPKHFIGFVSDISSAKGVEEERNLLFELSEDMLCVSNTDGWFELVNPAWTSALGWSREELISHSWLHFVHPDDKDATVHTFEKLASGVSTQDFLNRYRCKDGSYRLLSWRSRFSSESNQIVGIARDVTASKKSEEKLLRSQRMESIGTLAGGIAHDLNNVLTPIMMSIELLKMNEVDSMRLNVLETIEAAASRGAAMVSQVLTFARGVEGERILVDCGHLLSEIFGIIKDTFPKNIRLNTAIPADLWQVEGDPTQIHQVLINLCVNARDAMEPGGGTLIISAENAHLDEHYTAMEIGAKPGMYVVIAIEDSGSGMPREVMDRIFDPFFTTKEIGRGTGLGLATTQAIVQSHGGFIRVYTELGTGTRFKVFLPSLGERNETASPKPLAAMPRASGQLVLVVDDEAAIREIVRKTLEIYGYRVLLAADGTEAAACFAAHRNEIAVVIIDMMMPVMDGPATVQVLMRLDPQVRIIASSGLDNYEAKVLGERVLRFLRKPYKADALLRALDAVLSEPS